MAVTKVAEPKPCEICDYDEEAERSEEHQQRKEKQA